MKLILAPMEGVVDGIMRDILTTVGGIDQCVTEFIRVTNLLLPDKIFYDYCPELHTGSKTRAGTPVFIQLLGGQASPLADNAAKAVELGACGIDLNFGCPAKTVNRHDGGAALLKSPERIFNILVAVRKSVPAHIPVTAKIRLGFDDPNMCLENAQAVAAAGIKTLTVHCRTKMDMYKPPAYWDWIPKIRAKANIDIIANGEIWTVEDFNNCRSITACENFMLGRGAISNPFLFLQIKKELEIINLKDIFKLATHYFDISSKEVSPHFAQSRTKMWLSQVSKKNDAARPIFDAIKIITDPQIFYKSLHSFEKTLT